MVREYKYTMNGKMKVRVCVTAFTFNFARTLPCFYNPDLRQFIGLEPRVLHVTVFTIQAYCTLQFLESCMPYFTVFFTVHVHCTLRF